MAKTLVIWQTAICPSANGSMAIGSTATGWGNIYSVGTVSAAVVVCNTMSALFVSFGTASGTSLICGTASVSGAVIGGSGSFAGLVTVGTVSASGAIIGASGSFTNLVTAGTVSASGAVIGASGSFAGLVTAGTASATLVIFTSASGGSLFIGSDTLKAWFGAGNDMSLFYNGTDGYIKVNEVAASDLHVTCGTAKTIVLDNPVYDDLPPTPIISAGKVAAAEPTLAVFIGSIEQYTFDNVNDYVIGATEILHSFKEGTPIEAHVHWATAAATTRDERVKFQLRFSVANRSTAFGASQTISVETVIPSGTVDRKHFSTTIGTVTDNLSIGAYIAWRFERVTISTGTEITDPFVLAIGWHYQKDTIGSRQEYVK